MALLSGKKAKEEPTTAATSDSSDECDDVAECNNEGNSAWANAIRKVLEAPVPANTTRVVLSRAKKLKVKSAESGQKVKRKDYDFEIDGAEEEPKRAKEAKPKVSALDAQLTRQQRKNVPLQLRVKPSFRDIERERNLRKVATRGTVQFFNAVRIQQRSLQQQLAEAGPLDSRQDAVLNNIDKRKFLDVLMSGKRAKSAAIDNAVKKEETESGTDTEGAGVTDDETPSAAAANKKKSEWNVLREDFMTNKKIKHWDEEEEEQEEGSNADEVSADESDD